MFWKTSFRRKLRANLRPGIPEGDAVYTIEKFKWQNEYSSKLKELLPITQIICTGDKRIYYKKTSTEFSKWLEHFKTVVGAGSPVSGFIRVRKKSGRNYFSQGQGKVREFCKKSGSFYILIKLQKGQRIFNGVREKWINSNSDSDKP